MLIFDKYTKLRCLMNKFRNSIKSRGYIDMVKRYHGLKILTASGEGVNLFGFYMRERERERGERKRNITGNETTG